MDPGHDRSGRAIALDPPVSDRPAASAKI